MSTIEIAPYNPEWSTWFKEIREPLWNNINDLVVDIVHVGSTSIEGMSAKPIIDIDLVLDNWKKFPELAERLGTLGYRHVGDLGINGREVFNQISPSKYPHHLYACHIESIAFRNHILLKKHLTENPKDFKRYINLKIALANSISSRENYLRSKTNMILEFLRKEGFSKKELDEIQKENLG